MGRFADLICPYHSGHSGGVAGLAAAAAARCGMDAAGARTVRRAGLVHDLGRPSRFVNMLRVAKPTSPMSVGTWILTLYGPAAGLAGAAEFADRLPLPRPLRRLVRGLARPAGFAAAATAPAVASYTAVLLADTATPSWHAARRELPFVFVGSAAAAAGGLGLLAAPADEAGPARRLGSGGGGGGSSGGGTQIDEPPTALGSGHAACALIESAISAPSGITI